MSRSLTTRLFALAFVAGLHAGRSGTDARAQGYAPASTVYPQAPYQAQPRQGVFRAAPAPTGNGTRRGWFGAGRAGGLTGPGYATPGPAGANEGGATGLPRGRRYYNGRFFGSFNNRFYGPQYGYF